MPSPQSRKPKRSSNTNTRRRARSVSPKQKPSLINLLDNLIAAIDKLDFVKIRRIVKQIKQIKKMPKNNPHLQELSAMPEEVKLLFGEKISEKISDKIIEMLEQYLPTQNTIMNIIVYLEDNLNMEFSQDTLDAETFIYSYNNPALTQFLIERGFDINFKDPNTGNTLLMNVVGDAIQYITSIDVWPNRHMEIIPQYIAIVQRLFAEHPEIDINIQNNDGLDAMMIIAGSNSSEMDWPTERHAPDGVGNYGCPEILSTIIQNLLDSQRRHHRYNFRNSNDAQGVEETLLDIAEIPDLNPQIPTMIQQLHTSSNRKPSKSAAAKAPSKKSPTKKSPKKSPK